LPAGALRGAVLPWGRTPERGFEVDGVVKPACCAPLVEPVVVLLR